MNKRKKTPKKTETAVLLRSKRRCCVCFFLEGDNAVKRGQIAHLDGDSSNCAEENLAFLCFDHHDEYDSQSSQSKGLTEGEVKHFRSQLYEALNNIQHSSDSVRVLGKNEEVLHDEGSLFIMENTDLSTYKRTSLERPTIPKEEHKDPGSILRIIVFEDGSWFCRTVVSASDNNDRDTLLCFKVRLINNGPRYANIARYEVEVPSYEYQGELQPISGKEKVRRRTGPSSSEWLHIHSLLDDEGLICIEPNGEPKTGNLCFRIPIILPREANALECVLKLQDYDNHIGYCKAKLSKTGY